MECKKFNGNGKTALAADVSPRNDEEAFEYPLQRPLSKKGNSTTLTVTWPAEHHGEGPTLLILPEIRLQGIRVRVRTIEVIVTLGE
jgi:hypothetical protein